MAFDCKTINLKYGSEGTLVTQLQTILSEKGYYYGKIDGIFGSMTENAVKKLQRVQGNSADGWFGQKTCQKLQNTETTKPAENSSNYIGKTFKKEEILQSASIFRSYIKNNGKYPETLKFNDSTNKSYIIGFNAYMRIFEKMSMYFIKNRKLPDSVTCDGTANNPLVIDYQDTNYNCGPASLSMCFQMLASWITEQTISKEIGTTKNGSDYAMLKKGARLHGFNLVEIGRNIESVRKAITSGLPVLMHVDTSIAGGKSCLGYLGQYGHYIMCYGVEGNKYLIADPTKGFRKCISTSIDKAMKNRTINYFKLVPA